MHEAIGFALILFIVSVLIAIGIYHDLKVKG